MLEKDPGGQLTSLLAEAKPGATMRRVAARKAAGVSGTIMLGADRVGKEGGVVCLTTDGRYPPCYMSWANKVAVSEIEN